jgi:hypothetical protein
MDDIEFSVNLPQGVNFDYSIRDSFYDNNHGVLGRSDENLFDSYDDDDEDDYDNEDCW